MENLEGRIKSITIIKKYPSTRDSIINGCWKWLEGKEVDDKAERLWRIHDRLYDVTDYICKHPGGKDWLETTKGTDITEAFESHHISSKPKQLLKQFYVRDAVDKRNYYYTYDENGFYQTLKRRVAKKLETIDKTVIWKSKRILDLTVIAFLLSLLVVARVKHQNMYIISVLAAGQLLAWIANFSHNFIHKSNNWRMYASNLTLLTCDDHRVQHVLSHHMYPNSYADFEISAYEPYYKWIPRHSKTLFYKIFAVLLTPVMYIIFFHNTYRLRIQGFFWAKGKVFRWDELIALIIPITMFVFAKEPMNLESLKVAYFSWTYIVMASNFFYCIFFLNRGFHAPHLIHQGDEIKSMDFGEYQLSTISDRPFANQNIFTIMTYSGEQQLHHLFPTLDHALLPQLKGTFIKTCKEFDINLNESSMLRAFADQFKQLYRSGEILKVA